MALFRDIPAPGPDEPTSVYIDWASRRDPTGHRVHLALGMLALFLIPLASTPATIGSTLLFGYTLLRAPTLWRTWQAFPRTPALIAVFALFVWLACSTSWSPDPEKGIRLLRGSRYLLLIPALVPLLAHRRLLLQALVAGIVLQCAAQFSGSWLGFDMNFGGFSEHGGHTGLWYSLPLGFLLFDPKSIPAGTVIRYVLFAAIALGLVATQARSALAGAAGGLVIALVFERIFQIRRVAWGHSVAILICLIGLLGIVSITPVGDRVTNAWDAMTTPYEGGRFNIDKTRPLWWRLGIENWYEQPVLGAGLGSAESIIGSDNPEIRAIIAENPQNTSAARDDFHSTFVTVLVESGLIGFLILVGWMTLLLGSILRNREMRLILLVGFIAWLGYSVFNTNLFSGRLVAFSCTLLALSMVRDLNTNTGLMTSFKRANPVSRKSADGG